jgi:hypothetical protein
MTRALPLLFVLAHASVAAGAEPMVANVLVVAQSVPAGESIAAYSDPTRLPNPSQAQLDAFVLRFATCTECWPLNVARMASLGNKILGSLEKACIGDDRFLDIDERRSSFEATYYRMIPYMSPRIEKSVYVQRETDKLKSTARSRASEVLLAIDTLDARAIACGAPGS